MHQFDKDFKEILISQLVSLAGGLLAGTLLATFLDKLIYIPGMFLILPGFLALRGNISGSFASRISSGLFLGVIKKQHVWSRITRANILATFLQTFLVTAFLGSIAFGFNMFVLHISIPRIILLPIIAGLLANAGDILLTLYFTFYWFRKGHDPNNIMGPFVTSTGDILGMIALLITLWLI